MRAFCLLVVLIQAVGLSADASPQNAPNPRQDYERYLAQCYRFVDQADAAWDREMARENAGDCVEAGKAGQQPYNARFGKEVEITIANYKAYSAAFRAIFAMNPSGMDYDTPGPTGRPLRPEEFVPRFDDVEAGWDKYRSQMCDLAGDSWRGGTIAPSMGSTCDLQLIRNHMRELGQHLGMRFHM